MRGRGLLVLLAVPLLAVGGYLWAKAEHYPTEAVDRAQAFITLLEAGQLEQAQALALRNEYVGHTPAEFAELTARQLCRVDHVEWTAPPQTNGNRLRRWWNDVEVEMPEVDVEFQGSCLLKVNLRHGEDGQWRVFNLQRHAG
ncbi:hypothetical protein [Pseudomonas sp. GV071]|jgi:hypothetical protein|uniref:hypothetical protein n=1 Tax=Pseudomonas sp. GV071 TaxID=2135754 RepID=UPI000D38108C|nr:hypothetical protein [Pseudomonas sp. GV071]PTQ73074.1 hypothetical protein C8K61_102283 [Pseudomonas sp. GV071]